jgi:hypothetical protein
VLSIGDFRLLVATEHVLLYERRLESRRIVVGLNMTGQARSLKFQTGASEILLSTYLDDHRSSNVEEIHLRADEGLVLRSIDMT